MSSALPCFRMSIGHAITRFDVGSFRRVAQTPLLNFEDIIPLSRREPSTDWYPELALLAWPLLPIWRHWLLQDLGGSGAKAFGECVVEPLLDSVHRRHGAAPKEVYDYIVAALFASPVFAADDVESFRLDVAFQLAQASLRGTSPSSGTLDLLFRVLKRLAQTPPKSADAALRRNMSVTVSVLCVSWSSHRFNWNFAGRQATAP